MHLLLLFIFIRSVVVLFFVFFFKQKTAYEMRISDWSSDVCSSDLSTSLPELVTSIAAFRMGSSGLAVGNLFGSNAVNMVVFLAMDLAHRHAPIFANLHPGHRISGLLAVIVKIGRASCRERVCPYGSISGVADSLKKKQQKTI